MDDDNATASSGLRPTSDGCTANAATIAFSVTVCSLADALFAAIIAWIGVNMIAYGLGHQRLNFKTRKGQIYLHCLGAVATTLLAVSFDLAGLFFHPQVFNCELRGDIKTVLMGCAFLWMYTFLWFRQHLMFKGELMKSVTPNWIYSISYATIPLLFTSQPIAVILYVYGDTFGERDDKCHIVPLGSRGGLMDFNSRVAYSLSW